MRYCIAADGLHSPTRKNWDLENLQNSQSGLVSDSILNLAPWSPYVEVYWSEFGECYITPVSDTQVGVAILAYADNLPTNPESGKFESLLEWFPVVKEKIQSAKAPILRFEAQVVLNNDSRHQDKGESYSLVMQLVI